MEYRRLGRTEARVGIIGLGTEYIWHEPFKVVEEVVLEAVENGINYIDIFMGSPGVRDNIGKVLKKKREKVMIAGHLGCYDIDGQYAKTRDCKISKIFIDDFCKRLQTDYIDVLFLHNINEKIEFEEAFNKNGLLDIALKMKKHGKARFIGFSGHKVPVSLNALQSGYIDVFMYPVNPSFDSLPGNINHEDLSEKSYDYGSNKRNKPDRKNLYIQCVQRDIGLVAMKPFAGGRLFSQDKSGKNMLTPIKCLSYALSQPGVSTVVPGCKNAYEVRESLAYLQASSQDKDYSLPLKNIGLAPEGECMYCNHCQPCPQGLDIANITKLAHEAAKGLTKNISDQYNMLNIKASACSDCQTCEERCPFGVEVSKNIKRAQKIFGS